MPPPPPLRPVYDPAAQHQNEGLGGGTRNTATAFAKAAVFAPPPPPPPPMSGGILLRPRWPPHTSRHPWWLSRHREHQRVSRYACLFVS